MKDAREAITLVITGASGSAYGLRLLECLLNAERQVYLLISKAGRIVISTEIGMALPEGAVETEALLSELYRIPKGRLRVLDLEDWFAPVASGSNAPRRMVICPCTCGTLSAIANGTSNNLIERAADVVLKERAQMIVVLRETPLSTIHLENMLKLSNMGAVIMPASPAFYQRPERVEDLVDFVVARVLDHLGVESDLMPRWGADRE